MSANLSRPGEGAPPPSRSPEQGVSARDAALSPEPWRDAALPVAERVTDLIGRMSLEEKIGQLGGAWVGVSPTGGEVAPYQHDFVEVGADWPELIRWGLGHVTRPLGTSPVTGAMGAEQLARLQLDVIAANRFGIPAVAHEECLTGFMTWGATAYATPLAWGATFDPALVHRMAVKIGESMRSVGVHQGLAPVLDVIRDPRWGRTEEAIGEDPYLVGSVGTAYVKGLQSAGILATVKHFVGYSGSRAGRNFGPVAMGPRELADVFLVPFEMAIRDGGARSVMHSYAEIDGVPVAADGDLLTVLLRDVWGFDGTVVADYFGISFLETLHHIAADPTEAAALALAAGIDVELPSRRCYSEPLLAAVRDGRVAEELVDRAVERVLRQKCELGLLDPDWKPQPSAESVSLDPPAARELARQLAEESIVLLANDGVLPVRRDARLALVGPQADTAAAMLGGYTFPRHMDAHFPGVAQGIEIPTLLDVLRTDWPGLAYALGCGVDALDASGFAAAVAAARDADVCVIALGDRAGLFGKGTSGEGCDVTDLSLPGVQGELLEAVLATGTPTVLVLLTGRPYALGRYADRCAAIIQTFFLGEAGADAVVNVITGRANPAGRLPIGVPRSSGGQPSPYLAPTLGHQTDVSTVDPTPLYPFGHGLSYTTFEWYDPEPVEPVHASTDGTLSASVAVRNTGDRPGSEVVQLYLHDPTAQVTRPRVRLIGYTKIKLDPGESRRVTFHVPADLASFTGRDGRRIVEPGRLELRFAASSTDVRHTVHARLDGPVRTVDHTRQLAPEVTVD